MSQKKITKVLTPDVIHPASYNPRKMSEKTKKALKKSMEEFNDISGITWNKKTQNIVTGHHRWQNIVDLHGLDNLKFNQIADDKYEIFTSDNSDTGFTLRVVEWDEKKEKAANIAANSPHLMGEFTADLGAILDEISDEYDDELLKELRFDDLKIDLDDISEDAWESDIGKVNNVDENTREMYASFTVKVVKKDEEKIKAILVKALEGTDAELR